MELIYYKVINHGYKRVNKVVNYVGWMFRTCFTIDHKWKIRSPKTCYYRDNYIDNIHKDNGLL